MLSELGTYPKGPRIETTLRYFAVGIVCAACGQKSKFRTGLGRPKAPVPAVSSQNLDKVMVSTGRTGARQPCTTQNKGNQ